LRKNSTVGYTFISQGSDLTKAAVRVRLAPLADLVADIEIGPIVVEFGPGPVREYSVTEAPDASALFLTLLNIPSDAKPGGSIKLYQAVAVVSDVV
jgi:hypothetical protein